MYFMQWQFTQWHPLEWCCIDKLDKFVEKSCYICCKTFLLLFYSNYESFFVHLSHLDQTSCLIHFAVFFNPSPSIIKTPPLFGTEEYWDLLKLERNKFQSFKEFAINRWKPTGQRLVTTLAMLLNNFFQFT